MFWIEVRADIAATAQPSIRHDFREGACAFMATCVQFAIFFLLRRSK